METAPETIEALFIRVLVVEPEVAAVLIEEGFSSLEEIAYVSLNEFLSINGLNPTQVDSMRMKARAHLLSIELAREIDGPDEGDPLPAVADSPIKPMSGGGSAALEFDDEKQFPSFPRQIEIQTIHRRMW